MQVMEFSESFKRELACIEFHSLASIQPRMNEDQFEGLKDSLIRYGQEHPIVLYRGKVVDGRHRVWALKENGDTDVRCVELPRNTKLSKVRDYVMNTERRRHQTKNQLVCAAYLDYIDENTPATTLSELALSHGVSQGKVSEAKKVAEAFGIEVIKRFYLGEKVRLLVNGTYSYYASTSSIYSAMKRRKEEEWVIKKKEEIFGFNEIEERVKLRSFCLNDSVDVLKFKIDELAQLVLEKESDRRKLNEGFGV